MREQFAGPGGWLGMEAAVVQLSAMIAGPAALPRDGDLAAAWTLPILSSIAASALVWLSCDTARRMGGTPAAQWLAGLCVLANVLFLRTTWRAPLAVFEQWCWTLGLWALLRRAIDDQPGWWLWMVAALVAGLGSWSLAGAGTLDWPGVGPTSDVTASTRSQGTPAGLLGEQLLAGPAVGVACIGLLRLLRDRAGSGTRTVGVACAAAFGGLLAWHGQASAVTPIQPLLFGAGASQLSQWGESLWQRRSRWLVHALTVVQVAYAVVVLSTDR